MTSILKWFYGDNTNRLVKDKQTCMNHLDSFLEKIFNQKDEQGRYFLSFSELFIYYYEWLNKDSSFNFHDQYISTLTSSLFAFLKSYKDDDRIGNTKKFLENQLDMIIEDGKNGFYDHPRNCYEVYHF